MVRIGLSLYLMLAVVAGPSFCCCSIECLAALFAASKSPISEGTRCCSHGQQVAKYPHRSAGQQHPDKDEHPGHPSCPCQGHGLGDTTLASLDSELGHQLQLRQALDVSPLLLLFVTTSLGLSPKNAVPAPGNLPFLSTEDILCTLHILRC